MQIKSPGLTSFDTNHMYRLVKKIENFKKILFLHTMIHNSYFIFYKHLIGPVLVAGLIPVYFRSQCPRSKTLILGSAE